MANMSSDFPASSSQQPFVTPQPAPIAASPPTKQNLKSWWAGFRKETKKHDQQGNYSFSHTPSGDAFTRKESAFASKTSQEHIAQFKEAIDPTNMTSGDCEIKNLALKSSATTPSEGRLSFQESLFGTPITVSPAKIKRPSSSLLPFRKSMSRLRPNRPASLMVIPEHAPRFEKLSGSHIPQEQSGSGDDALAALQSTPKPKFFSLFGAFRFKQTSVNNSKTRNAKIAGDKADQAPGIFGVPLRQSITYANVAISLVDAEGRSYIYGYVPIVVAKCGVYLKEKATNVEGIFRLSGSEKRIKELKTIFDSPDRYGKGLDWAGYTVHDAANVLRRYLNQLPEPIVPLDLYDRFRAPLRGHTMQAVGDNEGPQLPDSFNVSHAIKTYQQLITELPPLNRQLLLYILDLLAVFASKSDENRMNSQNLAAIFQPGMLSHPSHDMAPSEYRLSQDVLIFLIENQDNFLIGMRGTAADEQTVQEVQAGATPPGTPRTPGRNTVGRSASNASAGADSVRKFGGVRRNVSVSSRNSRQSNGAPSPASPVLTHTATGGLNRSNTVPSKRSPGLPSNRLQKGSASPSPTGPIFNAAQTQPRGLSPSARIQTGRNVSPSASLTPNTPIGRSSLAPSSHADSIVTSKERLLADQSEKQEQGTPQKERSVSGFFNRSPTVESEKKQPNKLRKKQRVPSSNPSAQSSQNSLHTPHQHASISSSPSMQPSLGTQDVVERPVLEAIPSGVDTTPPATQTPRAEQPPTQFSRPEEHHQTSDNTLKALSPPSSLRSHSSFNDTSDADHHEESVAVAEQREKRSRWRLSRHRESSQNYGHTLSPRKGLGSDAGAGASTSSVGSASRPRKSFTGDTVPVGSESTLVGTHLHSSNESNLGPALLSHEEKKGPLGWFKNKMREKREESKEKEAEKERNKSPPASTDRLSTILPGRGKSMDFKREEMSERILDAPNHISQSQPLPQTQPEFQQQFYAQPMPPPPSVPQEPQR